jgi:hypothetical protein
MLPKTNNEALEPAAPRQLTGTRLIHYGPAWDAALEETHATTEGPVAVLVCHGMGQQVRYETISSVAEAILIEAQAQGGSVSPVEVHLCEENNSLLARAEIQWTDSGQQAHSVHVYEAYWAPLTEGRVSYWDTVKFLLSAAANGLWYSRPFSPRRFERWMFGGPKPLVIQRATFPALLCAVGFVLMQVAIIGFVLNGLAQEYKTFLALPPPSLSIHGLLSIHGWVHAWLMLFYGLLRWLGPFFPGHSGLIHQPWFSPAWWHAFARLAAWIAAIAEALVARYFIVEYVGDVTAYVAPYKDSKFDEIRQKIQAVGLSVGKVIYGFGPRTVNVPDYRKILVVGHSLGSVLAYDTLDALINQDNVSAPGARRGVVARTRALVTFGSPLDKTAFIFRMQARKQRDWIREQLAASVQPLIVSYALYRPPGFEWVNIWSPMDIISGELNYYDDPGFPPNHPPCVQNLRDPQANIPLYAHVQYWNNPVLREQLYRFIV